MRVSQLQSGRAQDVQQLTAGQLDILMLILAAFDSQRSAIVDQMWICGPNPRTAISNSSLKNLSISILLHSHTHHECTSGRTTTSCCWAPLSLSHAM